MLMGVLKYGLPSGIQNSVIGLANVIVQSNINVFGASATAGCGSYSKVEGFAFLPVNSFTMAISTFISQNLGAHEFERAKKGARFGIISSITIAELIGLIIFIFAPTLIGLFSDEKEVIEYGTNYSRTTSLFFFLLSYSHCVAAVCRGSGKAIVPMIIMLSVWCILRVTYISIIMSFTDDASTNLLYLIRDIFDMRKIERNEIEISHKSINILDFAESCIAKYSSELELKNTKINIDCGSIDHPYVLGDEIHLRHVIRRVIELFMKNSKDNSTIILKINENSYINKIVFFDFQIFVDSVLSKTLNSSDNSSLYNDIYSNSYNYNLPYLKRLVELMGGSFIITNDEELGPRMNISMSFAVDEETVLLKEIESFDTKESLKGTKILLVDDDLIQLSNAQEILSDEGVSVTIAKNGEEAIQKFIASRFNQFDAILIDVDMALLSGYETSKRIRAINRVDAQDIPIIALFDEVGGDEFKNVQYSGMNAYITKPITIPELLKTLIKVASNRSIVLAEKLASAINLATKDALTNISNRTAYDTYEKNIQNKIDQGENLEFAILFCDMNNLKEANDTYGHEVGDQSLKTTSKIICDIFKHSPVFRIGGDEFVVIIQNEDYKDRDNLLNKLKEKIKQEPIISLACGMATYMKSDLTVKNVLDRADAYMYEDKKIIKGVNIRN